MADAPVFSLPVIQVGNRFGATREGLEDAIQDIVSLLYAYIEELQQVAAYARNMGLGPVRPTVLQDGAVWMRANGDGSWSLCAYKDGANVELMRLTDTAQISQAQVAGLLVKLAELQGYADEAKAATDADADRAEAAAAAAQQAADDALEAALTAGRVYADTAAGLAATDDGDFFWVQSTDPEEALILYKNVAGAAVEQKRTPSAAIQAKLDTAYDLAQALSLMLRSDADDGSVILTDPYGYSTTALDDAGQWSTNGRTWSNWEQDGVAHADPYGYIHGIDYPDGTLVRGEIEVRTIAEPTLTFGDPYGYSSTTGLDEIGQWTTNGLSWAAWEDEGVAHMDAYGYIRAVERADGTLISGPFDVAQIDEPIFAFGDRYGYIGMYLGDDAVFSATGLLGSDDDDTTVSPAYTAGEIGSLADRMVSLTARVTVTPITGVAGLATGYNAVHEYGQSLSTGFEGWPARTKTARFGGLMLGNSPRPVSQDSATYDTFGSAVFQPLVANVADNGGPILTDEEVAALTPGSQHNGETMSVGFATMLKWLHNRTAGVPDDTARNVVVNSAGKAGRNILQLSKPSAHYSRMVNGATKTKAAAGADPIQAMVFLWGQGEYDYTEFTTKADYKTRFLQLLSDFGADITTGIYGQATPPLVLMYQCGSVFARDALELAIGMAQLELSLEQPRVRCYGPVYPVTDKEGHLTSNGYRWMGMQAAKVWHRIIELGEGWQPVHVNRAVRRGRTILLGYHVPAPPLIWRRPYYVSAAMDYASKGYRVTDGAGDVPIASVEIVAPTVVQIVLGRDPTGTVKTWYAGQATYFGNGCLCDSDDALALDNYEYAAGSGDYPAHNLFDLVDAPYPLNNWALAQVVTPTAT